MSALGVSPLLFQEISALAVSAHGREAAGACFGRRTGDGFELAALRIARNLAAEPDAFRLDPAELVALERDARERGLELLGHWHAHAGGDATPSTRDLSGAPAGLLVLIVRTAPTPRLRAWRAHGSGAVEVPLRVAGA